MLAQLAEELKELWQDARPQLRRAVFIAWDALTRVWGIARPPIALALQVLAALVVIFEEWGWRPLVELLGRLSRFRLWAMLELWIAGLPPYGALIAFALPTTILLPLKFVAVWLLANGHAMSAAMLFVAAKIASTALIARVFMLTKPALMRIGWFARAYNWFLPWKEALFAEIRASWAWRYGRMVKSRIKHEARQAWFGLKSWLEGRLSAWRPLVAPWFAAFRRRLQEAWGRVR